MPGQSIKPPGRVANKPAIRPASRRTLPAPILPALLLPALLLPAPAPAEDAFFERELALSAQEQMDSRGIHNELLTSYLYDISMDKAISIEEMPINLPFNGQGQGYINTNFLIQELIVDDTKLRGPYYAENGDFTGGGALRLGYQQAPDSHQITLGLGEDSYQHLVANGALDLGASSLLYGVETIGQDIDPNLRNSSAANGSDNAVLKLSGGNRLRGYQVNLMAHEADWKSESPRTIDRERLEDDSSGSLLDALADEDSHRYSLSASGWRSDSRKRWYYSGYLIDYRSVLNLEFLTVDGRSLRVDPVQRRDERTVVGGSLYRDWYFTRWGHQRLGLETRVDRLRNVGLSDVNTRTDDRNNGDADLYTGALFYRNQRQWNEWLRHEFGLRLDALKISAEQNLELDYDRKSDHRWNPKLSIIANPRDNLELFVHAGRGSTSTDGRYSYRGINTRRGVDNPPEKVRPLTAVDAVDVGFSARLPGNRATFSASWWQREARNELAARDAQVELRPSKRSGLEFALLYQPTDRIYLDLGAVFSRARFTDEDPRGKHIPGSTENLATLVLGYLGDRYYVNLDTLYLGSSPFLEDNSAETDSINSTNLYLGTSIGNNLTLELQVLNIADNDRSNPQISFINRVAAAEAFIEEFYFNPIPARTLRFYLRYYF